jgi:lysophospholipase L1-like esterase
MRRNRAIWIGCLAPLLAVALAAGPADAKRHATRPGVWAGAWASSQQVPEKQNALPDGALDDATLRQVVRLSRGGSRLRVRISNAFGTTPLHLTGVHVARAKAPGSPAIDPKSDHALTFGGHADVTVPAGAEYWSDPLDFDVKALASLSVSFHVDHAPAQQTSHPGSRTTSFLVHGDKVADADLPGATTFAHWFQLSGVDVAAPTDAATVVTLGDSITDGHGATTDKDDRWPDVLAKRLQASGDTRRLGVVNAGIGGNRLLLDGAGPNALARFDRDVLAESGVKWIIVLEGVNDLGTLTRVAPATPEAHAELVRHIIGAYEQIVARAHAHGVKAVGATILPYGGSDYYHPDAINEADRLAVNRWIREPGHFDAVVDFDAATRDPKHPERMRPDVDSGDHLHPGPAGYRIMGDAIPLKLFER